MDFMVAAEGSMFAALHFSSPRRRSSRLLTAVLVAAIHLAALWLLATTATRMVVPSEPPVFNVVLFPRIDVGANSNLSTSGGAPAAPSRIHTPPIFPDLEEEIAAPRAQDIAQPLVTGFTDVLSPAPGMGEGGIGDGLGAGLGSGNGPGDGGGSGPTLIQGPAHSVISESVSRAALYDSAGAHVVLRCQLRISERLERCRVIGEHPRPSGHRREALARAREFRIKPPTRNGIAMDRHTMTVALAFPLPKEEADQPSG